MSKKNKPIELSLKEVDENGALVQELFIQEKRIGKIEAQGERFMVTPEKGQGFKVDKMDDGINELIMRYNLHH